METVSSEFCRKNNELNVSSSTHGFIANIATSDTPACDGTTHPWVIRASPGQRINLTLYDFALAGAQASHKYHSPRSMQSFQAQQELPSASLQSPSRASFSSEPTGGGGGGGEMQLELCRQYGLLQDGRLGRPRPVCGAMEKRITWLHLSKTNLVKVWLTAGSAPRDLKRFVVEYRSIHNYIYSNLPFHGTS